MKANIAVETARVAELHKVAVEVDTAVCHSAANQGTVEGKLVPYKVEKSREDHLKLSVSIEYKKIRSIQQTT